MSIVCSCPAAAALTTVPAFTCGENFGQIQKLAFQRLYKDNGDPNEITATDILLKATWTSLMAAVDSTKIVVTPYVEAPTQEGGDPITFGGGNDTLGGAEDIIGRDASQITFALRKWPQSLIKALKYLQCETNLGVYLFSQNGSIEATKVVGANDAVTYRPLPIRSLFVGDKIHGGLENPDSNELRFAFLPDYSDDLAIVKPNFNPLSDLIPA